MALYLYVSNSLKELAGKLIDKSREQLRDVFMPEYFVTQTDGVAIWLRYQFAVHTGIAANIRFLNPNDLVFEIYRILGGSFTKTITRDNIVWLLYHLIGSDTFCKRFPAQADYFAGEGLDSELKKMSLCVKLADLFDQYQIYREELIGSWNKQSLADTTDWQAFLWKKLIEKSSKQVPDKTIISNYITAALKDPEKQERLRKVLPYISMFGLSIFTKFHLNILHQIAQFTDVDFYLLNPAPELYWQEDINAKELAAWHSRNPGKERNQIVGNALLTSWGKVLQQSFKLLYKDEESLNNYEIITQKEPQCHTLLGKIQNDIFNNAVEAERNSISLADTEDGSLVIQSCYTILREVDALYDYLVHLIDQGREQLSPRDILVMLPDVDAYVPFIKAVFDTAPYHFPYRIADTSIAKDDNLFGALHQVLSLRADSFTSENILQFLELSCIKTQFSIHDSELIRQALREANVRIGIRGDRDDETYLVSWAYGLQRIVYGLCMKGAALYHDDKNGFEFYPIDSVEGSDAATLIRFVHFVEVLIQSVQQRKAARNIREWIIYVEQVIHVLLFSADEDSSEDYALLQKLLTQYGDAADLPEEKMPFEVFAFHFLDKLKSEQRNRVFMSGGITFCSMIPMRSIPFKVIALLGLNADSFPRKDVKVSFSRIQEKPQLGDRNIKDNDKHLFLESLLSAGRYFYVSYLGKDVKNNSSKAPSIVVDELITYIQDGMSESDKAAARLVVQQPLNSYSHKYNQHDARLYKYAHNIGAPAIIQRLNKQENSNTPEAASAVLQLKDISNFFKNATKEYYNKTLKIYYSDKNVLLPEKEQFVLDDNLDIWALRQHIIYGSTDMLEEKRKGALPLKNVGAYFWEQEEKQLRPLLDYITTLTQSQEPKMLSGELLLGDDLIKGTLNKVYGKASIEVTTSTSIGRYKLQMYIHSLFAKLCGQVEDLYLVHYDLKAKKITAYKTELHTIPYAYAKEQLSACNSAYKHGLEKAHFFTPRLYENYNNPADFNDAVFRELVLKHYDTDNSYSIPDPYISNAIRQGLLLQEGIAADFKRLYDLLVSDLDRFIIELPVVQS